MNRLTADIQYRPGLLVHVLMIVRAMGFRLPARLVAWSMQRSGKVRIGNGPWHKVQPNLRLRGKR